MDDSEAPLGAGPTDHLFSCWKCTKFNDVQTEPGADPGCAFCGADQSKDPRRSTVLSVETN